jgi:hypothetical protein
MGFFIASNCPFAGYFGVNFLPFCSSESVFFLPPFIYRTAAVIIVFCQLFGRQIWCRALFRAKVYDFMVGLAKES